MAFYSFPFGFHKYLSYDAPDLLQKKKPTSASIDMPQDSWNENLSNSYLSVHEQPNGKGHIQPAFWLHLDGFHSWIG